MGACEFFTASKTLDRRNAFGEARDEAAYMDGHGGYTGTIAEKPGSREVPDAPILCGFDEAYKWAQIDLNQRDNDKWEDCWAVKVYDKEAKRQIGWLFYGWASS